MIDGRRRSDSSRLFLYAVKWVFAAVALGWMSAPVEADERDALRAEHRRLLRAVRARAPADPYIVINTQDNLLLLRAASNVLREVVCATGSGRKLEWYKAWQRRKAWDDWKFDTPKGRFSILRKVEDPLWIKPVWHFVESDEEVPVFAEDPRRFQRGVLGSYALYFLKDFMIHGTLYEINLGKSITHGCVRVGAADLEYLYSAVDAGCAVYIY